MRRFNTAGPVRPDEHYCVPPLDRVSLAGVMDLIRSKAYFVVYAPRQTGKTSALFALRDLLNGGAEGAYRCAYINVESAQTAREDVGRAMGAIATEIAHEAQDTLNDPDAVEAARGLDTVERPDVALGTLLRLWTKVSATPLVLLIDEVDALVGDSLVSVLRQLRAGYAHRPAAFPHSVVLCGVRDVRDYRIHSGSGREVITEGTAFNIKTRSLRLGDLTQAEIEALLSQFTAESGQAFAPEALDAVWEQTRGQPWLVNALAREMCFPDGACRPRDRSISERDVFQAREALILSRETHLDQLADKLREPRVRRVIEPLLSGDDAAYSGRDFGPQLVLQAFLHRVVNGEGRIEREYALGSRRVDLLVIWPGGEGRAGRFVVECKLVKDGGSHARAVEQGLEQTAAYMDLSDADAGHLVIFDMREARTWAEKIYREERRRNGTTITVWGA